MTALGNQTSASATWMIMLDARYMWYKPTNVHIDFKEP